MKTTSKTLTFNYLILSRKNLFLLFNFNQPPFEQRFKDMWKTPPALALIGIQLFIPQKNLFCIVAF